MSAPLQSMKSPHTPTRTIGSDEQSPSSSPRKRSVDQIEETEQTALSSPRSTVEASPYPCLCQPEPKIPRPRNAFILYRQHHNASVIARYPHLSNPDLSKVIGELWRGESEEEKSRWKSFAEEDKMQHAQKYPSYRYQPKRSNKGSHGSEGSPGPWTEIQTCTKCNGRKVAPPLPSASINQRPQDEVIVPEHSTVLPRRSNTITLPPPKPSTLTTPSTRYLPMHDLSLTSPSSARYSNYPAEQYDHGTPNPDHYPQSPKRRRISPHTNISTPQRQTFAFPPNTYPNNPQIGRLPALQQQSQQHDRRVSLPPASNLLASTAPRMPPPSRTPLTQHQFQHLQHQDHQRRLLARRTPPRPDLSLNLPPLHTAVPPSPATSTAPGSAALRAFTAAHQAQLSGGSAGSRGGPPSGATPVSASNSLALVRHKIGTLQQLLQPCVTAEKVKRGAIIAVEGDSPSAARELADWLGETMTGTGDVTVVDGPRVPEKEVRVEELLRTVSGWHEQGREMVGMVQGEDHEEEGKMTGVEGQARERKDSKSSGGSEMEVDLPEKEERKKLLVLRGYVLTATNLFAARIPLTGSYDPKGHWEWTACMWRGVVAPDVIIYVKDVDGKDGGDLTGCEVFDDGRLMVVRRCKGEAEKTGVEGVQAGALRRLGFEVGEWLRDFSG
ncbi:hypothetical protein B9Z65_8138 [Elsinoe australis]|uniref:HMG box domain-containing protein n=1 Tax=Elsinoe australis TaxID=40998 RepID=A0A2P7YW51_9PEZI|nr:hypothetical protein B9Z65_8138 [Elsinoe australis]